MGGDSIAHGTKFGAYEALFQQLESNRLGGQFSEAETGESGVSANTLWSGLAFKLEEIDLVIPCADIPSAGIAVATCGQILPLPLAKSWVAGMTHIRGETYTVVDFSAFFGKKTTSVVAACNLILLPDARLKSALLVAGRVRLRSFEINLPMVGIETLGNMLTPYLSSVLIDNNRSWGVIDIDALSNSAQFSGINRAQHIHNNGFE